MAAVAFEVSDSLKLRRKKKVKAIGFDHQTLLVVAISWLSFRFSACSPTLSSASAPFYSTGHEIITAAALRVWSEVCVGHDVVSVFAVNLGQQHCVQYNWILAAANLKLHHQSSSHTISNYNITQKHISDIKICPAN